MSKSKEIPLTVAIIGCGAITERYYCAALKTLCHGNLLRVTELFDPDSTRMSNVQKTLPTARQRYCIEEIIAQHPDIAIVASPPQHHAGQTVKLLQAGIAVLCEKPMATTKEEAVAMLTASRKTNTPLAIGLFRRFFPSNISIHEIVRNQSLGRVKTFEISEGGKFQWPAQSASFFDRRQSSGGVLFDLGVHCLDLIIWWFGMPTEFDYEDDAMGGLESNCIVKLGFANGLSGTLRLSRDIRIANYVNISCEHGTIRCASVAADCMEIQFKDSLFTLNGQLQSLGDGRFGYHQKRPALTVPQAFTSQISNFIDVMRGNAIAFVPPDDAVLGLQVIESCYQKRRLATLPWLSDQEAEQARNLA